MTPTAQAPRLFLATQHPHKGRHHREGCLPGVTVALTAGDGPSTNPKRSPNEDSLAVVPTARGVAVLVADAHWGPTAGELAAGEFVRQFARSPVPPHPGQSVLATVVASLDPVIQAGRGPGDSSETTALAVSVTRDALAWASVGDSRLFLVRGGVFTPVTGDGGGFLGSPVGLSVFHDAAYAQALGVLDAGTLPLRPGDTVVVASDGIDTPYSGLDLDALSALWALHPGTEGALTALMDTAGRAPGGGRDNLTVVAIAVNQLAPAP